MDTVSFLDIPDQLLLFFAHKNLTPPFVFMLAMTCRCMFQALLSHASDIRALRAQWGLIGCVDKGWFDVAKILLEQIGCDYTTLSEAETRYLYAFGKTSIEDPFQCITVSNGLHCMLRLLKRQEEETEEIVDFTETVLNKFIPEPSSSLHVFSVRVAIQFVFERACYQGFANMCEKLLESGYVDPTRNSSGCLADAVLGDHSFVVKVLLDDGRADPHANNHSAIFHAAVWDCVRTMEVFLTHPRVSRDVSLNRIFVTALTERSYRCLKLLLFDERVDPTMNSNEAYRLAVGRHDREAQCILCLHEDVLDLALDDDE